MPLLQERDREIVQQRFDEGMKGDVNVTLYTQNNLGGLFIPGRECQTCEPTQQLLEEVSELSPRINLEVVDFYANTEEAKAHGVDKIPAIIISGNGTDNVKYFGLPSGSEFAVLLETLIATSQEESFLQDETLEQLGKLKDDVHIQVFVTPQ